MDLFFFIRFGAFVLGSAFFISSNLLFLRFFVSHTFLQALSSIFPERASIKAGFRIGSALGASFWLFLLFIRLILSALKALSPEFFLADDTISFFNTSGTVYLLLLYSILSAAFFVKKWVGKHPSLQPKLMQTMIVAGLIYGIISSVPFLFFFGFYIVLLTIFFVLPASLVAFALGGKIIQRMVFAPAAVENALPDYSLAKQLAIFFVSAIVLFGTVMAGGKVRVNLQGGYESSRSVEVRWSETLLENDPLVVQAVRSGNSTACLAFDKNKEFTEFGKPGDGIYKDRVAAETCVTAIAINQRNVNVCERLRERDMDVYYDSHGEDAINSCKALAELAEKQGGNGRLPPSVCKETWFRNSGLYLQDVCFLTLGTATGDRQYCEYIVSSADASNRDISLKQRCLGRTAK